MISIITSCINRELYLKRLIDSIRLVGGHDKVEFEHFIVFQGSPPSKNMQDYIARQPFSKSIQVGVTEVIEPVGAVMNSIIKKAQYPIIFKIDDDCTLLTQDFLLRAFELCTKMPRAVIYPAMLDGECPQGTLGDRTRQSIYLEKSNLYLTVGKATVASGKYFMPTDLAKSIPFIGQKDPQQVMVATIHEHLPVFQVLNGIAIEIQEGYSGQHHRKENPDGQIWRLT